jgi:predicted nucleic acid-binding Zn ribbon protein
MARPHHGSGAEDRQGPGDPPEGIGGVVRRILGDRRMRSGIALGRLTRAWSDVVGEQLAAQTAPRALQAGTLLVAAASSGWGSQVRFLAPEIRRKANETLRSHVVRSVRVTVIGDLRKPLPRNGSGAQARPPEAPGKGVSG